MTITSRTKWIAGIAGVVLIAAAVIAALLLERRPGMSRRGFDPAYDTPRPIAAADGELWIERMTWMEVRDALAAGKRTVIVATGGMEQNGPYVVSGKHNVIVRAAAEAIARKLGNTLIAPIIPFVPEGAIDTPDGHMRYPGTISLDDDTYADMVGDVVRSLKAHGFKEIVLIGDSARNQPGLEAAMTRLNREWKPSEARVRFIPDYYDWEDRQAWLRARGFKEVDEGYHDELSVEAIMMSVDPASVRADQRIAAGKFSINGVPLVSIDRTAALGRALIDHIADITVAAIRRSRSAPAG